jgi:flagellar biosynthesis chaperone FliJ
MAKFHFRLQILFDQKLEIKRNAEEQLAKRQTELASEQTALADLQHQEESLVQELRMARRELAYLSSATGESLHVHLARIESLNQAIDSTRDSVFAQELVLDEFKEKVEQAKLHLAICSREAEILAKYRDKLERRFLRQLEQKEDLELDEIGNMLYLSRRAGQ